MIPTLSPPPVVRKRAAALETHSLKLADSPTYRDFLKRVFEIWEEAGHPMNYSEFARRAGFSSRSFPRAVLLGEKRLSEESLPRFVQTLQLKGKLKELFRLLVAKEEKLVSVIGELPKSPSQGIEAAIEKLRSRIKEKQRQDRRSKSTDVLDRECHSVIYAASGSLERGSAVSVVAQRTGLPSHVLRLGLAEMARQSLVKFDEQADWVWPQAFHVDLTDHSDSKQVQKDFLRSIEKLKNNAKADFAAVDQLFFQSVFSVSRSRMPELKKALRELLISFAEQSEDAEGDQVVRVVAGVTKEFFGGPSSSSLGKVLSNSNSVSKGINKEN